MNQIKSRFDWLVIKDEVVFNQLAVNLSVCRDVFLEQCFENCRAISAVALGKLKLKLPLQSLPVCSAWW